ncbi:MAG TPA: IS1380 family transposase [Bacteroidales bacterium]|nr:IS1380 family transposase [Bacteroidales bacterium]
MQVTYSTSDIKIFGGLNFANRIIDNKAIYKTIDQVLGNRGVKALYSYADMLRSLLSLVLCGGECAEDITLHLRSELEQLKGFKVCSADTLLRMQKELATEKETCVSKSNIAHEYNINEKLNNLLVRLLVQTGQLKATEKKYVFDYDNQFIPTEKYDSKRSYKHANGYFPGVASVNNFPVYVENRNGNSHVKYNQAETLARAYKNLADHGIDAYFSRMDCGSFERNVVKVVEANCQYFAIRAQRCDNLLEQIKGVTSWATAFIGIKEYQIASIDYAPFGEEKTYRYVITREKRPDGQGDLFTNDAFIYRAIMSNNYEMSDVEIVEFYNARGQSERLFDEMNNDFLWKKMPFSFLHENTVFLILMAICRNLFHFIADFVSKRLDFVKPNGRLKQFIFRFMTVSCKWIKSGRRHVLKMFTKKKYHLLLE